MYIKNELEQFVACLLRNPLQNKRIKGILETKYITPQPFENINNSVVFVLFYVVTYVDTLRSIQISLLHRAL